MFIIKILSKILKILHSNASPKEIALGISMAFLIGFSPFFAPQTLILFVMVLLINMNLGITFLCIPLFKLFSLLFVKLSHYLGIYLLVDISALKTIWTSLYNMPIVPFTKFNNTVVLGNLTIALILFVPIFFIAKYFVIYYRNTLMHKIERFKIIKIFKSSKIYFLYKKILHFVG